MKPGAFHPTIIRQDIRDILSEVSFVDRIVFGKWNYSKQANSFTHSKEFYNSMASEVIKFCSKNSIDVHIKEGTATVNHSANIQSDSDTDGYAHQENCCNFLVR